MVQTAGFWKKQNKDLLDFNNLEQIVLGDIGEAKISLLDYLHGHCTIAAIVLHDHFGYPIYRHWDNDEDDECENPPIASNEFPVIHDFCMSKDEEGFVDIRGVTENQKMFFEEFEDFFATLCYQRLSEEEICEVKENYKKMIGTNVFSKLYQMCDTWITEHANDYKVVRW